MKLDMQQTRRLLGAIDLTSTPGRSAWKDLIDTYKDDDLNFVNAVNTRLAEGHPYFTALLARLVARKFE